MNGCEVMRISPSNAYNQRSNPKEVPDGFTGA
jgi:hypothetical protein